MLKHQLIIIKMTKIKQPSHSGFLKTINYSNELNNLFLRSTSTVKTKTSKRKGEQTSEEVSFINSETKQNRLVNIKTKNPEHIFRFFDGNIQRQIKEKWVNVCDHNKQLAFCREKDCGGTGTAFCKHGFQRSYCKVDGSKCKQEGFCVHGAKKSECLHLKCKNSKGAICVHGIQLSVCKEEICEGGNSLCNHKIQRSQCADPLCKGGKALCVHKIQRSICLDPECKGGTIICVHGIQKARCPDPECGGGTQVCATCNSRKVLDGFCYHCHPTYEIKVGCSKIACQFIDLLEKNWHIKIQHMHFNDNYKYEGSEHRPELWKNKPIDGFFSTENTKYAIEFLGDVFHGHPRLWKTDHTAKNHKNKLHIELYHDTEKKLKKLVTLGYKVYVMWESHFHKYGLNGLQIFHDKLHNMIDVNSLPMISYYKGSLVNGIPNLQLVRHHQY